MHEYGADRRRKESPMFQNLVIILCLILYSIVLVIAQADGSTGSTESTGANVTNATNSPNSTNGTGDSEAKTLKGMSVLGNNEAPMSLFIVPWKSSELGVETNVHRTLDERDVPVDRDVFMRELEFYQVSVGGNSPAPAAVSQNLNSR